MVQQKNEQGLDSTMFGFQAFTDRLLRPGIRVVIPNFNISDSDKISGTLMRVSVSIPVYVVSNQKRHLCWDAFSEVDCLRDI